MIFLKEIKQEIKKRTQKPKKEGMEGLCFDLGTGVKEDCGD